MSEHLAERTEQWSAQQVEMDSLKSMMNGNFSSNGRVSEERIVHFNEAC